MRWVLVALLAFSATMLHAQWPGGQFAERQFATDQFAENQFALGSDTPPADPPFDGGVSAAGTGVAAAAPSPNVIPAVISMRWQEIFALAYLAAGTLTAIFLGVALIIREARRGRGDY